MAGTHVPGSFKVAPSHEPAVHTVTFCWMIPQASPAPATDGFSHFVVIGLQDKPCATSQSPAAGSQSALAPPGFAHVPLLHTRFPAHWNVPLQAPPAATGWAQTLLKQTSPSSQPAATPQELPAGASGAHVPQLPAADDMHAELLHWLPKPHCVPSSSVPGILHSSGESSLKSASQLEAAIALAQPAKADSSTLEPGAPT